MLTLLVADGTVTFDECPTAKWLQEWAVEGHGMSNLLALGHDDNVSNISFFEVFATLFVTALCCCAVVMCGDHCFPWHALAAWVSMKL